VASHAGEAQTAEPVAKAQFESLKRLAGTWTGKAGFEGTPPVDATVSYRVTSAGTAVIETLFVGTEHEMVTVYHRHGEDLLLTHYCAVGNQPRMKAERRREGRTIAFKFLDGTNLDPAKDTHMHEATIELVDDQHFRSEWVTFRDGKPIGKATFDLQRGDEE